MKYPRYIARVAWPIITSYGWIRKYAKNPTKYTMEEKYNRLRKLIARVAKGLSLEVLETCQTTSFKMVVVSTALNL